ncbi:cation channel sperm-associated auxiliary subunit epsilon isoform X4 [Lagopus muta]|uniref:cation channel sperm-associated auxiliary subunit epsilon isoform X4 n=1 Tax=Lagopus muta TaxID=64668 RepID=UPI0020A064EF|nr:cation channel sperm-associated auxiliary subunit epsilon isoform X4 [Lagopus muta]
MVPLRALFLLLLLRPETDCALWRDRTAEENYELFTSRKDTFEDEEHCLRDSDPSNCFTCYSTVASEMESADQLFLNEHQLILWIYDPESADASELNHTAVFPSESSQIVSKMLQIWGQKPVVQTYFKQKTYHCQRLPKSGTCYKTEARHVFKVGAEHKLPESEILRMHSRYWSSSVYPVQSGKQLSTWAAGMSTELYVGYNEAFNKIADTASLVKIVSFPNTASLTVSCDSVPCEVTMLLICNACSSSRLFFLAFYNEGRQLWGLGDFCLPVPHSSAMRMIYINSALSSGLLWEDVFATPIKTARIMDIFLCLDQHYQKCLMGALSTRLFSEFTFSHQTDNILESNYTQALELTSGVMSAELKSRAVENACELQHQVSHFFVGCPPGRHIAVKIYDGDICVRNVEANFVLWEIKGRTDNGYISSMKKNYRSCFELENSSKEGLNEQYQILNSTSQNHMARPFSHDATYVFRVRILTRNYRSDVSMAKLYSFITLSTLLVCATFCYRYSLTWKSETLGRRPKGQYLTDTLTK